MRSNKLSRYPEFLGYCRKLHTIKLSGNNIGVLPFTIRNCASTLRILDLEQCGLRTLPATMPELALTKLNLHMNLFPRRAPQANEIYKVRYFPATPRFPTLQEACVKSIRRHAVLVPQDFHPGLTRYIESVQRCKSCLRLVMESSSMFFYPASIRAFASECVGFEGMITLTGFVCSDKCYKAVCQGKKVVPAGLFFAACASSR